MWYRAWSSRAAIVYLNSVTGPTSFRWSSGTSGASGCPVSSRARLAARFCSCSPLAPDEGSDASDAADMGNVGQGVHVERALPDSEPGTLRPRACEAGRAAYTVAGGGSLEAELSVVRPVFAGGNPRADERVDVAGEAHPRLGIRTDAADHLHQRPAQ